MSHKTDIEYDWEKGIYTARCDECGWLAIFDDNGHKTQINYGDPSVGHYGCCGVDLKISMGVETFPDIGAFEDAIKGLKFSDEEK